jgi:hypothetical protein
MTLGIFQWSVFVVGDRSTVHILKINGILGFKREDGPIAGMELQDIIDKSDKKILQFQKGLNILESRFLYLIG